MQDIRKLVAKPKVDEAGVDTVLSFCLILGRLFDVVSAERAAASALRRHAKAGDLGALKKILDGDEAHAALDKCDKWGHTALMEATEQVKACASSRSDGVMLAGPRRLSSSSSLTSLALQLPSLVIPFSLSMGRGTWSVRGSCSDVVRT